MFLFSIFFKTPGKKCRTNAHREMAQCGTAESTLHLSLSFVLMEGIITAVRCSHPCKPLFWQWVSYTRHVGKERRLCSEMFSSSLQGAVHLSCIQLLTHFLSLDIFCFCTLHSFFLPGLVLHPLLSFQALALIIILLSQLLILFQHLVQFSFLS